MITLNGLKTSLRITTDRLDDEINQIMQAALLDMARAGIDTQVDNPLVDNAIRTYCRAEFDYLGKGQAYKEAYEELRDAMSLCSTYRETT